MDINLKRGDTLSFTINRKDSEGTPLVGDEAKLRSQLRDKSGALKATMIVKELTDGDYLFTVPASITSTFTKGTLYFDIEFNNDGHVTSSETMKVIVEEDITRDE